MFVKMTVYNLAMDPFSNVPIVLLRDESGELIVPIWVGGFEANAIALELQKIQPVRPITHDLLKSILKKLNIVVTRVLITDLKEGTYYAILELKGPSGALSMDSRPSDAIAMALRFDAPIFVSQTVIEKSKAADHGSEPEKDETEKLKDWLKSLRPEDFGKYGM